MHIKIKNIVGRDGIKRSLYWGWAFFKLEKKERYWGYCLDWYDGPIHKFGFYWFEFGFMETIF